MRKALADLPSKGVLDTAEGLTCNFLAIRNPCCEMPKGYLLEQDPDFHYHHRQVRHCFFG